ncbi:PREDICTED: transcription factor GTE12-like isoform X2 [Lupinus angustifolius]|uniref:transcription factor GTE12-like isoform X2 n=1 Tax=Lupinus angustifolius TaxID=3871 RepID=UPI00092F8553|nr:PREDICTED: transcription factor GTE12-like isoform X2 [Lupinus angustifolius]
MISTETIVPGRKLKIKFSTKKVEVDPGVKCEFGQQLSQNECCNSKKFSMPDSNKRGSPGSNEGQKEKRQKIDRKGSFQCVTILKSLISHPYSWVFSKPVDPVALNIPDYFTIISHPMDLSTIKSKLEKNIYSGIEEFAADVRLTFTNAMTYNPPSNDVHLMAKELNKVFDRKWVDFNKHWKCEDEDGKSMTGKVKETATKNCNRTRPHHKDTMPKRSQVSEHKGIQKISSIAARDSNVEVPKLSQIPCKLIKKDFHKGNNDGEHCSGSVKACPSLLPVKCKCSLCGNITCSCAIPSNCARASSDISCEGSEGRDVITHCSDASRQDCQTKGTSPSQRKSDPDSDVVSSLDSEHMCSSSQLATLVTDASSAEVWSTPDFSVQLSPKKALRAAMLKSRFADTIFKAQQKTLLDNGDKCDSLKMRLEKERLERIQREERAKIEAQIKTAEAAARMRAEEELRQQREKEREAARLAIQKMERTVEIEHNMEIIKELETLSGCTLSYKALGSRNGYRAAMETLELPQLENPLERLGLFIKNDYAAADEDEEVCWEEGEVF